MTEGVDTNQATELMALARSTFKNLFLDERGDVYAWYCPQADGGRVMAVSSSEFKYTLMSEYFSLKAKVPGGEAVSGAIAILIAQTHRNGNRHRLWVRYAWESGAIYVDLSNPDNEQIKISPGMTPELQRQESPRFRPYPHQQPMDFSTEGTPEDIKAFLELFRFKPEEDRMMFACDLVYSMVPDFAQPITNVNGDPGSAKSTMTEAAKRISDPSCVDSLTITDREGVIQSLVHHRYADFDNINDSLPDWLIDIFCRASTGATFSKRALYTNDEDINLRFKTKVSFNGLNRPSVRGDFMDRIVEYQLERISALERKGDEEVKSLMASYIPKVRWAAWIAISKAMKMIDTVKAELKEKPRNADFAIWGEAISRALGYEPFTFYNRLMQKSLNASETSVAEDDVAELIMKLVDRSEGKIWRGTATDLLETLKASDKDAILPANGAKLGVRLNKLRLDMQNVGYLIEKEREGRSRNIVIRTVEAVKAAQLDAQTDLMPPPEDNKSAVITVMPSCETAMTVNDDSKTDQEVPPTANDGNDSRENLLSQTSQVTDDGNDGTFLKEGGEGKSDPSVEYGKMIDKKYPGLPHTGDPEDREASA
jgi:hypothetical protein